jgi:hypothetical protein
MPRLFRVCTDNNMDRQFITRTEEANNATNRDLGLA